MATLLKVQPRWVLLKDVPDLAEIERLSFVAPWGTDEFTACIKRKHTNGLVVEQRGRVIAFLLFEVVRRRVQLLNLAVHPSYRGQGVATQLVNTLLGRLREAAPSYVVADVRETNLPAQLFLKSCGFRAEVVLREHFADSKEDAYRFEYHVQRQKESLGSVEEPL